MRPLLERVIVVWALLGGGLLLAIVVVTTVNVSTYVLDGGADLLGGAVPALPGYEDFVSATTSAAVLMLFPYCQLKRGHVAVDLVVDHLPPRVQRILETTWLVAMALAVLFLLYWMTIGMAETRADGITSPILGWPEWFFYLPGLVSLMLWLAISILDVLRPPGPT